MKTPPTFAVLLVLALAVVPARGDDEDKVATLRGEIEVLELRRDVDKELLHEAMLRSGRAEMRRTAERPDTEEARKRAALDADTLQMFIEKKTRAVLTQTTELKTKAAELAKSERTTAVQGRTRPIPPARPDQPPPDDKSSQAWIEELEEAQVEIQLLETQSRLYAQTLNEAVNALAAAEFEAGDDEAKRGKADAERKRFNSVKAKYVELSKRKQVEQRKAAGLRDRLGMGGIGGGFR